MKSFGNVLWGIVLIVVGLIIGGNALGITNINIFFDGWWTLFIIVPCFIGLFKEREKTGNIIGLLIGIALLLCCQDILDFDMIWKLALPVVLIIIGISFIFKDTFNHKINEEIKKLNNEFNLKNNLELQQKSEDYIKIQTKSNTIYAVVTMIISFVASILFNFNNYLPMILCILFCFICFILSFFIVDLSKYDKTAKKTEEKVKNKVKYNKIIIMLIISYGLFYPIVNSGQSNGKLFIQQELLLKFSVEKTSLIIGAILCVSRIVRVISNMAFNKIHSKYKEKVGFMLPILLMVSIFLMISGSMINNFIILKFIIMSLGYVIILFIRDPFKVYIQDLALRNVNNEEQQTLLTTMELSRKIIRTMISLNFTMILLNNPMKVVMVILFGLSIIEVLISIRLYKMILNIDKIEKKKRKIYVEEV